MNLREADLIVRYQMIHDQLDDIEKDMATLQEKAQLLLNQLEELRVKETELFNNNKNG